jgi:Putative Ig domain
MMAGLPGLRALMSVRARTLLLALVVVNASIALNACGGGGSDTATVAATPASPPPATSPPAGNTAPTISGTPLASVMEGTLYTFTPSAHDADGDPLTFRVTNLPGWATFDTATGEIRGTPGQGDVGTSASITVSVTDGSATTSLSSFTIDVVATATGSATLLWTPPTQNSDGTPLTDLAGYKIYWGTSQGNYSSSVTVNNPGLTSYVVEQLTPATWYFVATALNSKGAESAPSNVGSKTVL